MAQFHDLHICVATLRRWMTQEGLWNPKQRQLPAVHQIRPRRSQFGELIQIDGSYHRWFEERAPMCTLIVFIDDATSRLIYLQFVPSESTQAYMQALKAHLAA
ncbi:MAG: hypothetical protein AAF310_01495 [Myxococcota bacterium]